MKVILLADVKNLGTKDQEKAVELLQSIIDSKDISGEALAALGVSLFRKGEFKTANEVLNRAKDSLTSKHPLYKDVVKYIDLSK